MSRFLPLAFALLTPCCAQPALAQLVPGPGEVIEQVSSVYDGDTFTLARTVEPYALPLKVRIIGIDTPEAGRKAKCRSERNAAETAGQFLRLLLLSTGNETILRPQGKRIRWDAYGGRIDARVIIWRDGREQDVADIMVNAGHARAYDGKTKRAPWCPRRKRSLKT